MCPVCMLCGRAWLRTGFTLALSSDAPLHASYDWHSEASEAQRSTAAAAATTQQRLPHSPRHCAAADSEHIDSNATAHRNREKTAETQSGRRRHVVPSSESLPPEVLLRAHSLSPHLGASADRGGGGGGDGCREAERSKGRVADSRAVAPWSRLPFARQQGPRGDPGGSLQATLARRAPAAAAAIRPSGGGGRLERHRVPGPKRGMGPSQEVGAAGGNQ
jgi:hypothetical protein